jgi:hypothetical protein
MAKAVRAKPLEQLQREFVELRFGMFIHFGILTYTGKWGDGNEGAAQIAARLGVEKAWLSRFPHELSPASFNG